MEPQTDRGEVSYRGAGRLKGRRALITGADSGIGAAVAIAFAREGADIAVSYLPAEAPDAEKIAALIRDCRQKAATLPDEVSDPTGARELVAKAVQQSGGMDIIVNNAGKQISAEKLEDLGDEQFKQTFKTNVFSMFWIIKAALAHLEPGSTIINTTSVQAYHPSSNIIDYAATKAAVNNFAKGLAQQLAPRGIRVDAVAPGPVWTPLQVSDGQPKDQLPTFGKNTPLGRAEQTTELAPAYVFPASPECSYVAGEALNVNGGIPAP